MSRIDCWQMLLWSAASSLYLNAIAPINVLAHGGHGNEFQGGHEASSQTTNSIKVDKETASRLGLKVEPVNSKRLNIGIKTTGQIATLPNKQVEITAPIPGTIVELLVEPGNSVKKGETIAVLSSPELAELRVTSQEKQAEAQADLQQAQADLNLAQQNYQRYLQIATAEIAQAKSQLALAQERDNKDRELAAAGALPRRQALESQTAVVEAKAQLTKADSRRDVIEAQAQLKRAQSAVNVAKSRINLSNATYQTRLQQLGSLANAKGLVTVTAPISGQVSDRQVTLGQSFEDAGGKLMTVVDDSGVFATANVYEKDLPKITIGQQATVKVSSLSDRTFTGKITRIGSVVAGETRVVPVQIAVDNSLHQLKPGMFANIEILTNRTADAIAVIPTSAVVEANGKQLVYVQNGSAFQPVEVNLGQTSGNLVEVKSGLFTGDLVVTQRANQLYAQSLRGGNDGEDTPPTTNLKAESNLPWWLLVPAGGLLSATAFWIGRRSKPTKLTYITAEPIEERLSKTQKSQIK